jgi:hypothetical protein
MVTVPSSCFGACLAAESFSRRKSTSWFWTIPYNPVIELLPESARCMDRARQQGAVSSPVAWYVESR